MKAVVAAYRAQRNQHLWRLQARKNFSMTLFQIADDSPHDQFLQQLRKYQAESV